MARTSRSSGRFLVVMMGIYIAVFGFAAVVLLLLGAA
jgi:hypothetical protein